MMIAICTGLRCGFVQADCWLDRHCASPPFAWGAWYGVVTPTTPQTYSSMGTDPGGDRNKRTMGTGSVLLLGCIWNQKRNGMVSLCFSSD